MEQNFSFLKKQKSIYIKGKEGCRKFIEAVCWILRTGPNGENCQNNMEIGIAYSADLIRGLKKRYGSIAYILHRFSRFGICNVDATIVRAHACAAGYKEQNDQGLGRSKGGFTSKIHASVDALGNPLRFIVTAGQRNDITQANALLRDTECLRYSR